MKWADYNGSHFRITQQKTGTEMWIKAPKILRELLARLDHVHENILTHKWRKPYTRDSLGHRIKDVLIANGDGQYTTHGLRKNAGIMLAENGATVPMIMAALGHTTPKLALYYCRLAQQKTLNDQAVAIMDQVFERKDARARGRDRRQAQSDQAGEVMRGTRHGNDRQRMAVCSGFGRCYPIDIARSSRKLPDCDNSWARKAVNRNAAGAEPAL
jgi:hypothetical protein